VEGRERRHEVFGGLGREQERGAGHGVAEAEGERVEREAAEADGLGEEAVERAFSVVRVTDEGVVDVLEVAADLMETACQRAGLDEGGAAHVGREVGSRLGGHAVAGAEAGHGGDAGAVLAAGDRVIDGALVRGGAAHEGQVGLLDGASLEVALEEGGDLEAAREQEDAARGAVQAMDGRDAPPRASRARSTAVTGSSPQPRCTRRPEGLAKTASASSAWRRSREGEALTGGAYRAQGVSAP
jgi:hypothetical protein